MRVARVARRVGLSLPVRSAAKHGVSLAFKMQDAAELRADWAARKEIKPLDFFLR
jgi:hypothetical protein